MDTVRFMIYHLLGNKYSDSVVVHDRTSKIRKDRDHSKLMSADIVFGGEVKQF